MAVVGAGAGFAAVVAGAGVDAVHSLPWSRFHDELEDLMSERYADQEMRAIVSLARYAEAFAYDEVDQTFSLENPS